MIKVAKFGGSSVASAEQFKKVKQIVKSDVGRRFVVELEAGKESLHAGKVLRVLETLGIGLALEEPRGL